MPTVTFILGLCGSGKTHLATKLHRETRAVLFDEPIGRGQESTIAECLRQGGDCIVEELFYCIAGYRDKMLALLTGIPDLRIQFICYENDLEAANSNVRTRTNKGRIPEHIRLNETVSPHYSFPEPCELRPIFRI